MITIWWERLSVIDPVTVDILFSGSSGNCTLIRGRETAILIDAGRSSKVISEKLTALGMSPSEIAAVFVTHEHSDHISALDVFSSVNHVPIHITEKSFRCISKNNRLCVDAELHPTEFSESVGELTVRSFPVPHDSACNVGYVICDSDGDTVGIVTDMGEVTERAFKELSSCRRAIIEANHDVEMVRRGPYPYILKARILSGGGHLSNEACADLAVRLADAGCRGVALSHLSAENNTPNTALNCVREALDASGHADVFVSVSSRDATVRIPEAVEC